MCTIFLNLTGTSSRNHPPRTQTPILLPIDAKCVRMNAGLPTHQMTTSGCHHNLLFSIETITCAKQLCSQRLQCSCSWCPRLERFSTELHPRVSTITKLLVIQKHMHQHQPNIQYPHFISINDFLAYSNALVIHNPKFEWYVFRWGSDNKHQIERPCVSKRVDYVHKIC